MSQINPFLKCAVCSVSDPSLGPWRCSLCILRPRRKSPSPMAPAGLQLTLPLGLGPASLGSAPESSLSAQCARGAVEPIQSASVRPAVGATRSPPALPWHPGSPGQPRTRCHRPQIPMERQRWTETQRTGCKMASPTATISRATTQTQFCTV